MAGSDSVANFKRLELRHESEAFSEFGDDRRPCWRNQFVGLFCLTKWNSPQDFESCRSGEREVSMFAFDPAAALLKFGDVNRLNAQGL